MFHLDPIARIWIRQAARRRGLDIIIPYPGTALDTAKSIKNISRHQILIKRFTGLSDSEQIVGFHIPFKI